MNILLIGGYSHGNPGDEAIFKSTVYQLQELIPSVTLGIWKGEPDFNVRFDRPIHYEMIFWQPLPWAHKNTLWSKVLIKLYTDYYPISKHLVKWLNNFDRKNRDIISKFDKVIFIGGGYLNSDFCLLEMNYLATYAFRLGKPIYLLAQTLGPFKKKQHRQMAKEIFSAADGIVLRDSQSGAEAPDFKDKIRYTVDDALALVPRLSAKDKAVVDKYFPSPNASSSFYLGVNLRDWDCSGQYYPQIAKAIEVFAKSHGAGLLKILFIPMETSCHSDDREEGMKLLKHLPVAADFMFPTEIMSVEQTFYMISRLDLLIGMRFHSLLFALSSAVPAIGLYQGEYYFKKISGLFEAFGVGHHVVPINDVRNFGTLIRVTANNREQIIKLLSERKIELVNHQRKSLEKMLNEKLDKSMRISVVIPTMNRAGDLKAALDSVARQSYLPDEIILVDQSTNEDTKTLVSQMKLDYPNLNDRFRYIFQEEKSLVKARNLGLSRASGDLISFLDDDVVLFEDYYEQIVRCFKRDLKIGAISGNTLVRKKLSGFKWMTRKALMRFFLLCDFKGGMTASGFGYPIYEREIEKLTSVEFMPGCNMNFRRELIRDEKFDEWFMGYSFREDSDFSYRISKKTSIAMIPEAKLYHNYSTQNRLDARALKKMEIKNYHYVFKKYKDKNFASIPLFVFSLMGLALIDLFEFLTSLKFVKFEKFRTTAGYALSLTTGRMK